MSNIVVIQISANLVAIIKYLLETCTILKASVDNKITSGVLFSEILFTGTI